ncbi:hypothetical protein MPEAHAMD_6574 [Methylobacterium frigidaeris]|uniref:Histidine kinase n=1 Tax=Methylobacterium frigidaeris TaxID=2038277 RepID=A0AA37HIF7_9HYPH|nr:hypothetical protein MPEAHAMD_6574 [Methylobacterium frigidaeris]
MVEPTAKVARDPHVPCRSLSRVVRGLADVPTLFRFLAVVAILAGLAFAAMFALATFVEPTPREISVTIPNTKLQPK